MYNTILFSKTLDIFMMLNHLHLFCILDNLSPSKFSSPPPPPESPPQSPVETSDAQQPPIY